MNESEKKMTFSTACQGQTLEELKENIVEVYNLMMEDEEESLPSVIRNKVKQVQVEV